jgi:drug/metabolite transporter (DMT)-like permease
MDFYAYLFLSYLAGILVLLPFYWKKRGFDKRAWGYGSVAALASYIGVFCTLSALKLLPASVVYPITLSGPIILGMIISAIFFRERVLWEGWGGVLLGVAGITILSVWK